MIRCAVLGSPISHSLSPLLHNSAYKFLGIDGEYSAIEVTSGELEAFLSSHEDGWNGFSLTMPLKEEVISLASDIDPIATKIASANTLIRSQGKWLGYSTDRSGFTSLIAHERLGDVKKILILGAGGTARAILSALDLIGREIYVMRRSSMRDAALRASLTQAMLDIVDWSTELDLSAFDLVINTTPSGAAESAPLIFGNSLPVLIDVLYHPWPTQLAMHFLQSQARVIGGLELLLWQGIDQIELMSDISFDRLALYEHLKPILYSKLSSSTS